MIIPLGGGGSKVVASIVVTYPAGSTLTCTLGSKVLTAKDTSGKWVFGLPSTGNWVVKAVKGSKSTSKTVSITAEGQVETVALSYELLLFGSGSLASEYSLDTYAISPAIDVTNYSAMSIIGKITWMNYNLTYYVGLSPTPDGEWAAQAGFSSTTENTVDVDISSLSGLYYFSADNNVTLSITDGILELTTSNYTGVISQIKFS